MEIKSCPFCGGEAKVSDVFGRAGVVCKNCLSEMRGYLGMTNEDVVKIWNTRKPIDKVVEELEKRKEYQKIMAVDKKYRVGVLNGFNDAIEIVKGGVE